MPLVLDGRAPLVTADVLQTESDRAVGPRSICLDIGLLNNMPDAALKATESQYVELLAAAAGTLTVRLHVFSSPDVVRGEAAQTYIRSAYGDYGALTRQRLDALIVTGAEPKAEKLTDEPYWSSLAATIDWAEHSTISTIWSCLAAHAAVLHLDGIGRQRLDMKRSGLFECVKTADVPLLAGTPTALRMPHSRWNDLRESELRAHGYRVLSRSMEAGIDMFVKPWRSRFVFFQGHPEYAADTLYREYRRDMQRFLQGTRATLPEVPAHYFDFATEQRMAAFGLVAAAHRTPETFAHFPRGYALRQPLIEGWRASAVRIFRNWLVDLAAAKG